MRTVLSIYAPESTVQQSLWNLGLPITPVKHLRLRRDTSTLWLLDFANHRGRWAPTPFRAPIPELVEMTIAQLPWTVANQF